MIRYLIPFLLLPMLAQAQSVTIQSGEHDSFSRLVLRIGAETDWTLTQTDGGYLLNISGDVAGFRTASVFEMIPRDRIADVVEVDAQTLFIEVVCACYVDTFPWQNTRLVLDVIDGEDPDRNFDIGQVTSSEDLQETAEPLATSATLSETANLPNLLALDAQMPAQAGTFVVPMELLQPEPSPEISATEAALIEGLARAASQGVLEPAVQPPPEPEPVAEPVEIIEVIEPMVQVAGPRLQNDQPGIGISTSIDRDLALIGDAIGSIANQNCLPADLFNIGAWGDERPIHEQIAALAEALAGEFGQEPRDAQEALARLYIHFGFGAEARLVLAADTAQSQSRQVLTELAGLVDDYSGPFPLLESQFGCETAAALWQFYLNPSRLDDEGRKHILQQFYSVPQPLRGQLAPRFAQKFIEVGDASSAARVLGASDNSDTEATHSVQATQAMLAEELQEPERAIEVLTREAQDNARTTPESVIRLIELALEQGQLPTVQDLELAASLRQEFRTSDIAPVLTITEARGWSALGEYQTALGLIEGRDDEAARSLTDQIFAAVTENAPALEFLEFAYEDLPNSVTPDTENEIASRMIDLGFPERASEILRGATRGEANAERRYLRAEAALGTEEYLAVIDGLVGMNDPRAQDLRSRAYSALGEYRAALEATEFDPEDSRLETLQFRAGAWDRLTTDDDEVLSSFAGAILSPTTTDAETLADREAILQQSQESRRAIEGLLGRFDVEGGSE